MKFKVTSIGMNRKTRRQIFIRKTFNSPTDDEKRIELIDTETNVLFKDCENAFDVEQAYEAFWNELSTNSEHIVKVIDVEKI